MLPMLYLFWQCYSREMERKAKHSREQIQEMSQKRLEENVVKGKEEDQS